MTSRDEIVGSELVEVATIWSRAELVCFVSVLRDNGIQTYINGDHFGQSTLHLIAIGGYRVCVPEFEVERAIATISELRGPTEALPPNVSRARRLFRGMLFLYASFGLALIVTGALSGLLAILGVFLTPMPMNIAGDYRDKRGRLIQMK